MVLLEIIALVFGFLVLTKSASEAIKRVTRLSIRLGFEEFTISFVIIGLVTILPELAIAINSALEGTPSFGLGILFGSNIADLTLVIGIVALFSQSLTIHRQTLRETSFLITLVALPALLLLDGEISRIDGIFLLAAFGAYLVRLFHKHHAPITNFGGKKDSKVFHEIGILFLCVIAIIFSAQIITDAAKNISILANLPLFFIGILIAVGTCLPELTVAIKANKKKHGEIGLGDVLGNVFADSTASIGIIAIISPIQPKYPQLALASAAIMLFAMLCLVLVFKLKHKLTKKDGVYFILLYVVFLVVQFLLEEIIVA